MIEYGPLKAEKKSLQFRRSLYVVKDIAAGEPLTRDNIRAIRPGFGHPPQYIDHILGSRATVAVKRGTPVSWVLCR